MSILVISDSHLGVKRVSGTTIETQFRLREFIANSLSHLLATANSNKCLVEGDLFDLFTVETADLARAIRIFAENWLNKGKHLWLAAGNHDDSAKGNKMSHFELLCQVLSTTYPGLVHVCMTGGYVPGDGWIEVEPGVIAVAHHCDQNAFMHTLRSLKPMLTEGVLLFVHANFDNGFAARSDHSLNIDREMAGWLTELGTTLIFAHEHQPRTLMEGKVVIMGNQWPSSIADCLGNETKYGHIISGGKLESFETWNVHCKQGFGIVDWRELGDGHLSFEGFIRVEGEATAEEASSVLSKISKFRGKAKAFVVSNHVTIDGIAPADDDETEIIVDSSVFNLMEFVKGHLTEPQYNVFSQLKEKHDAA